MSHRGADELSTAIDEWLTAGDLGRGIHLQEIVAALERGLPPVADGAARERVRRRLTSASPRRRSAQELLVERALDELDRLQHRLQEDDYLPWPTVGAAALAIGLVVVAYWWRRPGAGRQPLP